MYYLPSVMVSEVCYDTGMSFAKLPPDTLRKHKGKSFPGITVIFFCYDEQGQFLLAKRSEHARDEKGAWAPGAGGLKHGERAEDAVRRELQEEYGTTPLRTDFFGYFDVFRKDGDAPTH
jgi:8-oxo-dGTP pyrophosphatase MutT (NUDIX family)